MELLERGQKETIEHIQKIHADELKLKLEEQERKLKQTQEAEMARVKEKHSAELQKWISANDAFAVLGLNLRDCFERVIVTSILMSTVTAHLTPSTPQVSSELF